MASPSEKGYESVNDSPAALTLSWDFTTTPVNITSVVGEVTKLKPTATLVLKSTKVDAKKMAAVEEILYGKDPTGADTNDGVEPRLPLPDEIISIMKAVG